MRATKFVDGLALAGALIALVGVSLAANDALAADAETIDATAVAIHDAGAEALAGADKANADAAADAASTIRQDNKLDLDIRLFDHKSRLIAASR